MAMPFIFGNHQCPFRTSRVMSIVEIQLSRLRSRERFSFRSRRSEGAIYGSRLSDDAELSEKIRGDGHHS